MEGRANEDRLGRLARFASLRTALIGLVVISLVCVGVAASIVGTTNMRRGMEYEVETGVMATCASYAQVLNYTTKDLTPEESASITLEQEMNAETGYDYTFFRGDTRERSSIDGVVGTKAGDAVIAEVINNKNRYSASNVMINGEPYYVAYIPLLNDDGSVYGMAFVGLKKVAVTAYITKRVAWTVTLSFGIIVVFTLFAIFYTVQIIKAIEENVRAVRQMATGDLEIKLSDKVKNRPDELGEMSSALYDMAAKIRAVIGSARVSSNEVDDSAGYLNETVKTIAETADNVTIAVSQVATGASSQAESLQEAVLNVNDINDAVQLITANTEEMQSIADSMQENSRASQDKLTELRMST